MNITDSGYDKSVEDSIRFYSNKFLLSIYDLNVTYFNNRFAWKCPKERIVRHYTENLSYNHLEVGVASVYYLQQVLKQKNVQRLAIMDLNENCLRKSAAKLHSATPEVYQQNILQPIEFHSSLFNSIGLNYVLHVVPGSFEEKGIIFKNLKSLMNEGGVLFGNTLLTKGVQRNFLSRLIMSGANKRGYFHNENDSLAGLQKALSEAFEHVKIDIEGCAAIFQASDKPLVSGTGL